MYKFDKNSTRLVGLAFLLFVLLTSACGNDTSSSLQVFRTSSVNSLEIIEHTTIPESDQGPSLEKIKQGEIEYLLEAKSWQFHPEGDFVFSDKYGNQYIGWWVDKNGRIEFEGKWERTEDDDSWDGIVEGFREGNEIQVKFERDYSSSSGYLRYIGSKYTAFIELK